EKGSIWCRFHQLGAANANGYRPFCGRGAKSSWGLELDGMTAKSDTFKQCRRCASAYQRGKLNIRSKLEAAFLQMPEGPQPRCLVEPPGARRSFPIEEYLVCLASNSRERCVWPASM